MPDKEKIPERAATMLEFIIREDADRIDSYMTIAGRNFHVKGYRIRKQGIIRVDFQEIT